EPDHIHDNPHRHTDHYTYPHANGPTDLHAGGVAHFDPFPDSFSHTHSHESSNPNTAQADIYSNANTDAYTVSYANLHTHLYADAFANAIEYSQPHGYGCGPFGANLPIGVAWRVDEAKPQRACHGYHQHEWRGR